MIDTSAANSNRGRHGVWNVYVAGRRAVAGHGDRFRAALQRIGHRRGRSEQVFESRQRMRHHIVLVIVALVNVKKNEKARVAGRGAMIAAERKKAMWKADRTWIPTGRPRARDHDPGSPYVWHREKAVDAEVDDRVALSDAVENHRPGAAGGATMRVSGRIVVDDCKFCCQNV